MDIILLHSVSQKGGAVYTQNFFIQNICTGSFHNEFTNRQISNIRRTESQHLNDSRTVLRLSLPNPLKPDVKSRMKM